MERAPRPPPMPVTRTVVIDPATALGATAAAVAVNTCAIVAAGSRSGSCESQPAGGPGPRAM